MDTKLKFSFLYIFVLIYTNCIGSSFNNFDSIVINPKWNTLKINKVSENGKWLAVTKKFENNTDTLLIVDTKASNTLSFTNVNRIDFINDFLFAHCKDDPQKLNIINLKNKEDWQQIITKKIALLKQQSTFVYIPKNSNQLIIKKNLANKWNTIYQKDNVTDYFINPKETSLLIIEKKKEKQNIYILELQKLKLTHITTLSEPIHDVIWNFDQSKVAIINDKKISIIDLKQLKHKNVYSTSDDKTSTITARFISNNEIVIKLVVPLKESRQTPNYLDIWNGNDRNLERKKHSTLDTKFSTKLIKYNLEDNIIQEVTLPSNMIEILLNNQNKFILIDPLKHKNYLSSQPLLDIYLSDYTGKRQLLIDSISNANKAFKYSKDGKNLAIKKNENWTIYNINDKNSFKVKSISKQGELIWTDNSQEFFIIGDNNLWKFNINTRNQKKITNFYKENLLLEIINKHSAADVFFNEYIPNSPYIDSNKPILLHVINTDNRNNLLLKVDKEKIITFIKNTPNKLSNFNWSLDYNTIALNQENYNLPPFVHLFTARKSSKIINNNLPFNLYNWRKQKIIEYKDSFGNTLKGLLYYPKDFDPKNKYPMITHLYQDQFYLKNRFDMPTLTNYMGFSIPLLNELGYFVFLPETKLSELGPGLSALDNVKSSIKKVTQIEPSINKDKLGLIGQSFGGYETNFIITQTNIFAAAISGAAINDLVWDYYSYGYNFAKPYYWRYEDKGQLEMLGNFSENQKQYLANSPILFAHNITTPLLSWAGMKDYNVHWEHTRHFYIALKRYKIPHIALFYQNEGHSMSTVKAQKDLTIRTLNWFDYYLKDNKNIKWINNGVN